MPRRRRRQHGFGRINPAELDRAVDALIRNVVGDRFGDSGAACIPPGMLVNPRVRRAFGLDRLPDAIPEDAPFDADDAELHYRASGPGAAGRRQLAADRERVAQHWAKHGTCERVPCADAHVGRALKLVGRTLGLTRLDVEVLQLVVAATVANGLAALLGQFPLHRRENLVELVASALGRRPGDVRPRLQALAPLFATGLVHLDTDVHGYPGFAVGADPRLVALVLERGLRREKLLARFLTPEPAPVVGLDAFGHLRADLDPLLRVLATALASRRVGTNVLLHGPSGVGKTEVARALAAALGADLFAAGAADEEGEPLSPRQRLASLRVGHRILAAARALMVFDELEDLDPPAPWEAGEGRAFGKLFMNKLLEENPAPTIWITNSIDAVDAATLRRFTFHVRFPALGALQRRMVWERVAGAELSAAELDERASAYEVSPGEIASAVKAARGAGDGTLDRGVLDRILANASRVMGRKPPPAVRAGAEYRPGAANASTDLVRLADRICAWRPGAGTGVSVCLYGPSGTGKSEWAHYLAKRTGRPLLVKGPSDLQSKWVGETEKLIARAFEEAEQQDAILLLDECDWALRDRRAANFEWEQTRVAELLQQLEAFRGIVVCTTNLFRELDQAVLRRFVHKVEFYPATLAQALLLWDAHLARFLPPDDATDRATVAGELRRLPGLTPGDFAVVARRAAQLGDGWTAEALLRELAAESAARAHEGRPIGF